MNEIENKPNPDLNNEDVKLEKGASMMELIEALLKSHKQVYQHFQAGTGLSNILKLLFITIFSLLMYGLIMGAFSMGVQWIKLQPVVDI